jgi:hypothetical protein
MQLQLTAATVINLKRLMLAHGATVRDQNGEPAARAAAIIWLTGLLTRHRPDHPAHRDS